MKQMVFVRNGSRWEPLLVLDGERVEQFIRDDLERPSVIAGRDATYFVVPGQLIRYENGERQER